jgi:hypothetical protein
MPTRLATIRSQPANELTSKTLVAYGRVPNTTVCTHGVPITKIVPITAATPHHGSHRRTPPSPRVSRETKLIGLYETEFIAYGYVVRSTHRCVHEPVLHPVSIALGALLAAVGLQPTIALDLVAAYLVR